MLYNPPTSNPQQGLLRHRCRNPRCQAALAAPTFNRLDAFCCRGCFAGFFRSRCVVCEQLFNRKNERQRTCRRPKCRSEFKRHRGLFGATGYPSGPVADIYPKNPIESGLKSGTEGDRPWRKIAGPDAAAINFRIRLDFELAARLRRTHAGVFARAGLPAVFQRDVPPLNVLGGYRFRDAPAINLKATVAVTTFDPAAAALVAAIPADLSIPGFLRRAAKDEVAS
jgi:hypothetical protein